MQSICILLLFVLLSLSNISVCNSSSCSSPNEHTQIYTYWKGAEYGSTLFLPHTFIFNIFNSPNMLNETFNFETICKPLPKAPRKTYIQFLNNSGIECSGSWCIDDQFKCLPHNLDCYHAEHIIDLNDECSLPDVKNMEKNILGNLIMSWGRWNMQIGKLKWEHVEMEKRTIYGDEIVDMAIYYITKCNELYGNNKNNNNTNNSDNNLSGFVMFVVITIIVIVVVVIIGTLVYFVYEYIKKVVQEKDIRNHRDLNMHMLSSMDNIDDADSIV
jgi:hypothetical protein